MPKTTEYTQNSPNENVRCAIETVKLLNEIIKVARSRLDRGSDRIWAQPETYRHFWWPEGPSIADEYTSDYYGGDEYAIQCDVNEEVQTISEILEGLKIENATKSLAMQYWDFIAAPVRLRGNSVYRVYTSRDVLSEPIVKRLDGSLFLYYIVNEWFDLKYASNKMERSKNRWRNIAIFACCLSAALLAWSL